MQAFKNFDFYPKTADDFRIKTLGGGVISIVSLIVIFILTFSELYFYMQIERFDELYVDTGLDRKIPIHINLTFPAISCDALSLDVMDVSGEHHIHVEHTVYKQRLSLDGKLIDNNADVAPVVISSNDGNDGKDSLVNSKELEKARAERAKRMKDKNYCGSCYGSAKDETACCNTCDDVRESYRKVGWAFNPTEEIEQCYEELLERKMKYAQKEGCNLHGYFLVNKVAGNFHFAPGKSFVRQQSHVHDYTNFEVEHFNTSHIINSLGFGEQIPGMSHPLDGTKKIIQADNSDGTISGLFQYFVKVVPTIYESYSSNNEIITNQYSVTQHFRPKNREHANVVPGVFFIYDLSPIMVHIKERKKSFLQFLTSLCAIVGGVFTVSALIDKLIYGVSKRVERSTGQGNLLQQ
ncbi:hypothetical protein ABK040_001066 [Willaertia magna]